MRAEEAAAKVPHSYTTARTLLSILRLAQALARLRFDDVVNQVRSAEQRKLTWALAPIAASRVVLKVLGPGPCGRNIFLELVLLPQGEAVHVPIDNDAGSSRILGRPLSLLSARVSSFKACS